MLRSDCLYLCLCVQQFLSATEALLAFSRCFAGHAELQIKRWAASALLLYLLPSAKHPIKVEIHKLVHEACPPLANARKIWSHLRIHTRKTTGAEGTFSGDQWNIFAANLTTKCRYMYRHG